MEKAQVAPLTDEIVMSKIYVVRGQKVMLDMDFAQLYQVETKRLNEQVTRNISRFPPDFMFQLTPSEWENLKSQIATSSWGGSRKTPSAFTEHGVLMLSSVLHSNRAVQVNIQIMRIYAKIRAYVLTDKGILLKLEKLEKKTTKNTDDIKLVFTYLRELLNPGSGTTARIGFRRNDER